MDKDTLMNLYSSGKSMRDISLHFKCSEHKVVYWMQKYKINRRSRSEAVYTHFNPEGDPFKINTELTLESSFLKGLGIGIFWDEGTKNYKHSTRVANTNPALIRTFIKFLTQICGVKKSKIRYSIVCFNDTLPDDARKY